MKSNLVKRSIIQVLRNNKRITALLILVICGIVVTTLVPPQILKLVIDRNLVPKSTEGLFVLAAAYIGVLVVTGVLDFLKEAALTVLGQKITKDIRLKMMEKLEKISAIFFSANESGTVVSRFTNDVEAVSSMFTGGIIGMIIDCFKITGIVFSILLFSTELGIITLLMLPLIYGFTRLFQKKMLKAQIQNKVLISRVNNHIAESLKNIQMIKSFSKEGYMEKNYTKYLLDNYKTVEKVNFYDSVFSPIIQITRAAVIGLIVVLSSKQLNFFGLSLGMVAASIDLVSNLFSPIETLGMELQNIQHAISGIHRVNEFYNEPEEEGKNNSLSVYDITRRRKYPPSLQVADSLRFSGGEYISRLDETPLMKENFSTTEKFSLNLGVIIPVREEVELSFNDVSFYYEEGTDILENINLNINPLQKVTFTGRTGVGKSTLFKLIMGLLKPTKGSITINGIDVCDIPNTEKRKIFGYVDQSFYMIKGNVADQISLQDENITREQILKALDFVGLTDYIMGMENGLDTQITGDSLFSQGQKQLLAIARATVTNPPILLLDEITANLDSITEEKILSVLQKASREHTILSISHRLSSMLASDIVVILEKGRVKNAGSPEMLLQNDEWFRSHIALEKLTWS